MDFTEGNLATFATIAALIFFSFVLILLFLPFISLLRRTATLGTMSIVLTVALVISFIISVTTSPYSASHPKRIQIAGEAVIFGGGGPLPSFCASGLIHCNETSWVMNLQAEDTISVSGYISQLQGLKASKWKCKAPPSSMLCFSSKIPLHFLSGMFLHIIRIAFPRSTLPL